MVTIRDYWSTFTVSQFHNYCLSNTLCDMFPRYNAPDSDESGSESGYSESSSSSGSSSASVGSTSKVINKMRYCRRSWWSVSSGCKWKKCWSHQAIYEETLLQQKMQEKSYVQDCVRLLRCILVFEQEWSRLFVAWLLWETSYLTT